MLGPDPADEVVSARVELYYSRNAHRVAQILNRNVKSHNTTAVTAAEQAAEDARGSYSQARVDRRSKEDEARSAASQLRDMKARLARLVESLRDNMEANQESLDSHAEEIRRLRSEKVQIDKEMNDLKLGRENLETLLKAQIEKQLSETMRQAASERKALADLDADIDVSKSTITALRKSTVKTQNELDTVDRPTLENARKEVDRLLKVADANQGNPAALKSTLVQLKSAQDEVQKILTEQAKKQNTLAEDRVELAKEFEAYRTASGCSV